jgi:hypothetical protein
MKFVRVFLFAAIFSVAMSVAASAQSVVESGFCTSVANGKCASFAANGASVKLSELPVVKGQPSLFFAATLADGGKAAATMVVTGSCYGQAVVKAKGGTALLPDVLAAVGVSSPQGVAPIVFRPTNVPEKSKAFHTYDYRGARCGGEAYGIVLDGNGKVLPGENSVKKITVVK